MIAGVPVSSKDILTTWIDPYGLAISPDGAWVGMLYQRAGRYRLGFFPVEGDQCPREIELPYGRPGGADMVTNRRRRGILRRPQGLIRSEHHCARSFVRRHVSIN